MSFVRPTLAQIVARVQVDFISRLELTGAVLRRSTVYVLSRVIAGAAHMLHGHLDWLARQLFPDTSEAVALVRQAAVFGMVKNAPTYALAPVAITGTSGIGPVPVGTLLVRSDGAVYAVVYLGEYGAVSATIALGVGALMLKSVLAGATYSCSVGTVFSFQSPIAGINSAAVVNEVGFDGTDEEKTEALRVRFLERLAEPPMGGASADYIAWAKEVPGVTRVWVVPLGIGPGTVVVRFVKDPGNSGTVIPDVGMVAGVQAYIDTVRPAHATVTVVAPVAAPIAFTIAVVPNTAAVKAAVTAELTDLLLRDGEPGVTVLLSALRTAIGTATGLTDYTLTVPAVNITHTINQLPTLGTITWA